ncbi:MAG: Acetyl xylan esterase, partial [Phycisphaerales bacterium]|nr:Acetyl xylan esterase [Phycisphaerales bacterium]
MIRFSRSQKCLTALLLTLYGGTAAIAQQPTTRPTAMKPAPAPAITVSPASGVVAVGEAVTWTLDKPAGGAAICYRVQDNDFKVISSGEVPADGGVRATFDHPGWMTIEFRSLKPESKLIGMAGAIVEPEKMVSTIDAPADFEAFWKNQLAESAKLPLNAVVTPGESGKAGIDYAELVLDNVGGKHTRAHIARPSGAEKLPALVIFQWAGVYQIPKTFATDRAGRGWLVMVVNPHDLPMNESKAFYDAQGQGALKNYTGFGGGDPKTSYFRTMFVGDYRAMDYLTSRPDWDGKTLVVQGASQGGMQSVAMAALYPNATAMMVGVPAGCDTLGETVGHAVGFPNWGKYGDAAYKTASLNTGRYYDPVNFAPMVKAPSLVCFGLRDQTSPPPGVLALYHKLAGPKEWIINPNSIHTDPQPLFEKRVAEWID